MKKNVSLGKQLQFVNLKMLVLTHLYFYSHIPPHPHPLTAWEVGEGCQVHCALVAMRLCSANPRNLELSTTWPTPRFPEGPC